MPNTREKLIDMVFESLCAHSHKSCKLAENIADDLIANSVTINRGTEDTPVAYKMSPTESLTNCQQWIPVTERLPDDGEEVIVFGYWHEKFQPLMCYLSPHRKGEWFTTVAGQRIYDVTHWMPLPDPPKGE